MKRFEEMSVTERTKKVIESLEFIGEIDTRRNPLKLAVGDDGIRVTNQRTGRHLWIKANETANDIASRIRILA